MILDRDPVSAMFEPLPTTGAEAPWIGSESTAPQAVVRAKRILLVEDEKPLRESLRLMLELDGHDVTEAGNGAEALDLFSVGDFDLVITDFQMPVMEGNELAVSIKEMAPSLPILMITASERARGNVDNPVDTLLNKPVTVAELRCALGRLCSASSGLFRGEAGWVPSITGPAETVVCQWTEGCSK